MKDHEIAQLVNELTKVAKEFHATQQLRERISQLVIKAVKFEPPYLNRNGAPDGITYD